MTHIEVGDLGGAGVYPVPACAFVHRRRARRAPTSFFGLPQAAIRTTLSPTSPFAHILVAMFLTPRYCASVPQATAPRFWCMAVWRPMAFECLYGAVSLRV